MTIAKTSTSYPVLSVIQEFNLTGEAERIVWKLAEQTLSFILKDTPQDAFIILHRRLRFLLGDEDTMLICGNLYERLARAHESYRTPTAISDINLSST